MDAWAIDRHPDAERPLRTGYLAQSGVPAANPSADISDIYNVSGYVLRNLLRSAKYIGTAKDHIVQKTVPGGHIGLFMGANTIREH